MIVFPVTVCKGFLRETRTKHQSWYSQGVRRNAVKFFGFFKKGQEIVHTIPLGLCICFLQKNVRVHDPLNHFSGLLAGYTGKKGRHRMQNTRNPWVNVTRQEGVRDQYWCVWNNERKKG